MTAPTCTSCGSADLFQVRLAPQDRKVLFTTCRSCEHREWVDPQADVTLELSAVLRELAVR